MNALSRLRFRRPRPLSLVALGVALALAARLGLMGDKLADLAARPQVVEVALAGGAPAAEGGGDAPAPKGRRGCDVPPPAPPPPPPQFSDAELAVLRQLGERRVALAAREAEFERRQAVLQAAEARLDEKVAAMKALQATLEALIRTHDAEQEAKLRSLVRIYETMKPKDAARIFEDLGIDALLPVVERMNERRLAPVMAVMNPAKARDLTVELQRLRQLVQDRQP
jgi:flagellar motility protein MotE (MotC chaperone)